MLINNSMFSLINSGWNIRCMDSGNMHHFVGADSSCISWGHAQNGELGYGPSGQKYVYATHSGLILLWGVISNYFCCLNFVILFVLLL